MNYDAKVPCKVSSDSCTHFSSSLKNGEWMTLALDAIDTLQEHIVWLLHQNILVLMIKCVRGGKFW